MSITQEMVEDAEKLVTDIQAEVFFKKLASLGVVPGSNEQAATLWELGDAILQEQPRLSDAGRVQKLASLDQFGKLGSAVGNDGCSLDAHKIVDGLARDERVMKAAHILMAVNNAG